MPLGSHNTGGVTTTTTPSTPRPTDSGVCAISPSDLVGYTGNLINRVNELEQRIAELEAANVEVNQLSDLSQQIGWVDGVTYMGVPGWTQTEYGSLIPPAGLSLSSLGFTLSDGNTYPLVVMDEDGVLQFGFTNTGAVSGASSGGGGVSSYIILQPTTTALSASRPDLGVAYSGGSAFTTTDINIGVIHIIQPGLYRVSAMFSVLIPTTAATRFMWVETGAYTIQDAFGQTSGGNGNQAFRANFTFPVTSTDDVEITFTGVTNLANIDKCIVCIERIRDSATI